MKKLSIGLMTVVLLAGGCSSASKPANKQDETKMSTEPVTLKLYNYGALTPEVIDQMFVKPVKQKYPHITLEVVKLSDMPIANIAVSGNEMDIITGWGSLLDQFGNYKLLTDLNPYIQKHKIDLSRFEKSNLEGIRLQSDTIAKGSLMALPFGYNYYATFYNKSIFDKFGVAYPSDGMTWDQAIELGKKLTRMEGGVQYKGLDPEGIEKVGNSLSIPYVDPVTFKAAVNTDGWKKAFELTKRIHDIPGNDFQITSHGNTVKRFVKDKNVAMLAAPEVLNSMADADFDWDVAEYPSFPERPHISGVVQTFVLQIASNSKHPEQSMQVIQLATSDEVQTALSRSGIMLSTLQNEAINKNFGADHPLLKNKHIESILKTKPAPYVVQTRFTKARGILEAKYKDYAAGKKDVNTALREANEEIDAYIATEK
ncbi:extracellular solute-binding protein [Paenibacillus hemerocallicola]|uniref:Extracellular solute-binding protein n=1 Tax=Paenibacillus hemerocallicola TaxID=1172614 RepID=A0A5C4T1T2_9BACL|nr:extracellular solute-binding protein [Paenibacillus hemerocallicola]TNJ62994.1 extracellular solute-binding protein [Paenibacillus hemerocallicola]